MTLTRPIKNWKIQTRWNSVQTISLTSTITSAFLVLRELCFHWLKRLVELVQLERFSTRPQTTVKINCSSQTCKIPIGQAQNPTLTFRSKLMKRPRTYCTENVQLKNLFRLEKSVLNAGRTSTLIMISKSAISATTGNSLTRTCTVAHTVRATSRQTPRRLRAWFSRADQRTNGCTFTTRTFNRMMVWRTVPNKSHTLTE